MPYSSEFILLLHPALGVLAIMASIWTFVELLNAKSQNLVRMRLASVTSAILMWATYIVAGYWYVTLYAADKALIKAGPWPLAHGLFMETKEHVFFMVLLLATLLPIATFSDVLGRRGVRHLAMWIAALVVLTGLAMEGSGAIISMGAKLALLAKTA